MKLNSVRLTNNAKVVTCLTVILASVLAIPAKAEAPLINTFKVSNAVMNEMYPSRVVTELKNYTKRLTPTGLVSLLKSVGFKGQALKSAWAVAMRETHGNPLAYNNNRRTGDNSYGLFQVNMIDDLGVQRREHYGLKSNNALFDPVTNASIVYKMTNGGKNWSSWGIGRHAYRNNEAGYYEWLKNFPISLSEY